MKALSVARHTFNRFGRASRSAKRGSGWQRTLASDGDIGGFLTMFGVELEVPPPGHPWLRVIESRWRSLHSAERMLPGYWGSSPDKRPGGAAKRARADLESLYTVPQYTAWLQQFMDAYNHEPHMVLRRRVVPADVLERERGEVRRISEESLNLWCTRPVGERKATASGVTVEGVAYGVGNPKIWQREGKEPVLVRVPPDAVDRVAIFDRAGKFITWAVNEALGKCTQQQARIARRNRTAHAKWSAAGAVDAMLRTPIGEILAVRAAQGKAELGRARRDQAAPESPPLTLVRPALQHAAAKAAPQVVSANATGAKRRARQLLERMADELPALEAGPKRPALAIDFAKWADSSDGMDAATEVRQEAAPDYFTRCADAG